MTDINIINDFFDENVAIFPTEIDKNDGRFKIIAEEIQKSQPAKVLDLGCGKGRFTKALNDVFPGMDYHGVDISEKMLAEAPDFMTKKKATLLDTTYPSEYFDFVFSIEALEHAVDIESAIKEMHRVLKKSGKLVIIDKNIEKLGKLKITAWEQWFDKNNLDKIIIKQGFKTRIVESISYNNSDGKNGLFLAWIAKKDDKM